ncbi:Uncharacterized protein APZ42_016988 [Daphnia magna]|uniref:Uncharacterized protein n=1 Tax=Daphnia magna TaxID=35525 RepID=A0A165A9S7_9CRUS|nr:Uncharacterized protein APZ42_016988 [Daphnia magna]
MSFGVGCFKTLTFNSSLFSCFFYPPNKQWPLFVFFQSMADQPIGGDGEPENLIKNTRTCTIFGNGFVYWARSHPPVSFGMLSFFSLYFLFSIFFFSIFYFHFFLSLSLSLSTHSLKRGHRAYASFLFPRGPSPFSGLRHTLVSSSPFLASITEETKKKKKT